MRNQIRGSVLLLLFLSPVFAGAEAQYTLGGYCRMLEQMQSRYTGNATARESLAADHAQYCADLNWHTNADSKFSGTVNPYIANNPDNVAGESEIRNYVERSGSASTLVEKYRAARDSATQLMTECHARSARSFEAPRAEAVDVLALLNGEPSEARVNAGCGRIGSFESGAELAESNARRQCEDLQARCRSMVNGVDEALREMRGTATTTPEMSVARSVAHNACNVMVDNALNQGLNVARTRADLDRACTDARRRLAEAPSRPSPSPAAPKTAEAPASQKGGDFWSTAAQMVPQALNLLNAANEPATDLATGQPLPTTVQRQPMLHSSEPGSLSPGAVKGDGIDNTSLSRSATDPILMGDEPVVPNGERSRMGRMPQQPSGLSGTPSASGSAMGAEARHRAVAGRGSRFDTNVYGGAMGGDAYGRAGFKGGGYPEVHGQGRARARAGAGHVPSVEEMNHRLQAGLRRFLPPAAGRLPTALMATGPDGITGPHSNIFRKVSKRYQLTPFSILPSQPSK